MEKFLTIIIPCYNSAESLSVLLESVGDYNDTEIIVIDDKSTEYLDFYKKIKSVYKGRVRFFFNDGNVKSAGAVRNIGLGNATGKWLLFADSDDYFLQGWHQNVSKYFDSDSDIIFFPPVSINSKTKGKGKRGRGYLAACNSFKCGKKKGERDLRYMFGAPWSKMIRRELVEKHDIRFEEIQHYNDIMFSAKIGYFARMISVGEDSIYCATERKGSLTTVKSESALWIRANAWCRKYNFLLEHGEKINSLYPLHSVFEVLRSGYGLSTAKKFCNLYKRNHMPVFNMKILILCFVRFQTIIHDFFNS